MGERIDNAEIVRRLKRHSGKPRVVSLSHANVCECVECLALRDLQEARAEIERLKAELKEAKSAESR